ncbi:MAG TPA: cytochrome c oxidase subunit II [Thermoanaerobaculaceae bacterium]|nr:cytochrome c oxidase subunit II [Thermoanaerobaculaceae bacterium]HPS77126.1 cytochrome c oxidase subunit II [Thermoanaerobaculaceae bacterium]
MARRLVVAGKASALTMTWMLLGGVSGGPKDGGFWMPPAATATAGDVDTLFHFILGISAAFFLLIVGLMVLFVFRYHRGRAARPAPSSSHNTALELTWTIIPLILVVVIFGWGVRVFLDINTVPADAYEVQVTGQKWKWFFTYPNGHVDENLHVPVHRPVRLVMTSEDVIHSFFVPAFRIKRDVLPGRYTKLWFEATRSGEFQVFCAEYCGAGHSDMLAQVIVHEPGGFEKWLEQEANVLAKLPPAEAGARLYKMRGCAQCHSVDGKAGIGPTFLGLVGEPVPLQTGGPVSADENYIRESILEPQAKLVAGFQPVMPTYKGRLKDQEITAIISYLKTLQKAH